MSVMPMDRWTFTEALGGGFAEERPVELQQEMEVALGPEEVVEGKVEGKVERKADGPVRHVRTPEGVSHYDLPIGSIIVPDIPGLDPSDYHMMMKALDGPGKDGRPKAVIFDRDGTLASVPKAPQDRSNDSWAEYNAALPFDRPVPRVAALLRSVPPGVVRIMTSGRAEGDHPGDRRRRFAMQDWIDKHDLPIDVLLMRAGGDQRRDSIVKEEILNRDIKGQYDVRFAVDDREQVAEVWERNGITTLRVEGPDLGFPIADQMPTPDATPEDITPEQRAGLDALMSHPVNVLLGEHFAAAGHPLFLVGGSVRDAMAGHPDFADLDYTTDATPDEIKAITDELGPQWGMGEQFGTVGIQIQGLKTEITTFRTERYDEASRKPVVDFGDNIWDDLKRRDLTMNAMALTIAGDGTNEVGRLVDPFGGAEDLRDGLLRTPDDPMKSMSEDPLRQLRVVRFAAKRGAVPEPVLEQAIIALHDRLGIVAPERKTEELRKVLQGGPDTTVAAMAMAERLKVAGDMFGGLGVGGDVRDALSNLPGNADPITQLSVIALMSKNANPAKKMRAMRLSNEEAKPALDAAQIADQLGKGGTGTVDRIAARALVRGTDAATMDRALVVSTASFPLTPLRNQVESILANAEELAAVRGGLPINGADLVAEGLVGPEVGAALLRVANAFLNNLDMTREEALGIAGVETKGAVNGFRYRPHMPSVRYVDLDGVIGQLEEKMVRHVRTPEGVAKYGEPIGSPIIPGRGLRVIPKKKASHVALHPTGNASKVITHQSDPDRSTRLLNMWGKGLPNFTEVGSDQIGTPNGLRADGNRQAAKAEVAAKLMARLDDDTKKQLATKVAENEVSRIRNMLESMKPGPDTFPDEKPMTVPIDKWNQTMAALADPFNPDITWQRRTDYDPNGPNQWEAPWYDNIITMTGIPDPEARTRTSQEEAYRKNNYEYMKGNDPRLIDALASDATSDFISGWASTSNDNNPQALAVQEAIREEFGLGDAMGWKWENPAANHTDLEWRATLQRQHDEEVARIPMYRKMIRAQYDETQAWFKDAGVSEVLIYRGMTWGDARRTGNAPPPPWFDQALRMPDQEVRQETTDDMGEVTVHVDHSPPTIDAPQLRPASSWAYGSRMANNFAGGVMPGSQPDSGHNGVVLSTVVPVSAVLSTPRTGFGSLPEEELVVLSFGGTVQAKVIGGVARRNLLEGFPERDFTANDLQSIRDSIEKNFERNIINWYRSVFMSKQRGQASKDGVPDPDEPSLAAMKVRLRGMLSRAYGFAV